MDFIPEVKMDFIPSDNEEEIDADSGEENPNFRYEEEKEKKDEIVELPTKKSDGMDINTIFNMPDDTPVRLTKKGKPFKKRPPMSEAHKEKLKEARVKAMESRQNKAKERKELKSLDIKEKELLKKQRVKKIQKLEEDVEQPFEPRPPTPKQEPVDVEKAVFEGINKYETLRKQRKKEKQKLQAKEDEDNKIRDTLMRAVEPKKKLYNPYAGCY